MTKVERKKLREACELVEHYCRAVGTDCGVVFITSPSVVEVSLPSWGGSCVSGTMFASFTAALKEVA